MTIEQKIIISLFDYLKNKSSEYVRYEDFVVHAFKQFPESLSLKYYPEYPDSELIKKRLYDTIKQKGIVTIKNHKLKFTEYGYTVAEEIYNIFNNNIDTIELNDQIKKTTFTPSESRELKRLLSCKGFTLYVQDKNYEILDVDYYDFFQFSARTKKGDIKSKISVISFILDKAFNINSNNQIKTLIEYKDILNNQIKEDLWR